MLPRISGRFGNGGCGMEFTRSLTVSRAPRRQDRCKGESPSRPRQLMLLPSTPLRRIRLSSSERSCRLTASISASLTSLETSLAVAGVVDDIVVADVVLPLLLDAFLLFTLLLLLRLLFHPSMNSSINQCK